MVWSVWPSAPRNSPEGIGRRNRAMASTGERSCCDFLAFFLVTCGGLLYSRTRDKLCYNRGVWLTKIVLGFLGGSNYILALVLRDMW